MGLYCVADEGFQLRDVTMSYFTGGREFCGLEFIQATKVEGDQPMAQSRI